jgi:hypothetical protein
LIFDHSRVDDQDRPFAFGIHQVESESRGARPASRQADYHTRLPRSLSCVARPVWWLDMSDGKLTAHEDALIDRYGPGSPPQAGTLYFYDYDSYENLPDDPGDRDVLANARLRFWTSKAQRKSQRDENVVPDQRAQQVDEHDQSAFELKWWPLNVAIAWVLTRDRTFVERQWKRRGRGSIGIDVALADEAISGAPMTLKFPGVDEAWIQMRSPLADGLFKTIGTPFRRVAADSASVVEASESPREIPEAEIASLVLHEEGQELCLIPEDWRVASGSNWQNLCGYRNVQVRPNGLIHYFPVLEDLMLPSENLGPPRSPFFPGWMSVSDAAYWIASEGGRALFSLRDLRRWQAAFGLLLPLLSAGQIAAVGRRHGRGLAAPVPPPSFAGIAVDYPYSDAPDDLLWGERPHLRCYGIVDGEQWEQAHHDRLMGEDSRVPEYSHLQVSNSDLAREFPFAATDAAHEPPVEIELPRKPQRLKGKPPVKRLAVVRGLREIGITSVEQIRSQQYTKIARRLIDAECELLKIHYPKRCSRF